MRVAILHNEVSLDKPDSVDVLAEAKLVQAGLEKLGAPYAVFRMGLGMNSLLETLHNLSVFKPEVVFNLVEAFGTDPRVQAGMAAVLDVAGIPYTGSKFSALLTTTDKTLLKTVLQQAGIATPDWDIYTGQTKRFTLAPPWFIKPAWEDGSVGIDDQSLVSGAEDLTSRLSEKFAHLQGQPLIVETFIEGREFNVALLEHPGGSVEILPPAEILFADWPADKPRIVNYDAKWSPESFEYQNTPRSFGLDPDLQSRLRTAAWQCWHAFQLQGYARVDMRTDLRGNIFVVEVNANPCIAPECGFIAAAQEAGYAPHEVIDKIIRQPLTARSSLSC